MRIDLENTENSAIEIMIQNRGKPMDMKVFEDKQKTLSDHQMKIKEFGGSLDFKSLTLPGSRFYIRLISREGFIREEDPLNLREK
jgi:hypothetical protein